MDLTTIAQREQVLRGELAAAREAFASADRDAKRARERIDQCLHDLDVLEAHARAAFCRARGGDEAHQQSAGDDFDAQVGGLAAGQGFQGMSEGADADYETAAREGKLA